MNYLFIDAIVTVTFISTYMLLLWVATLSNPIEIYFGNILGPKCNSNMITQTVSNKFFKSYCMSLNGSQLWDYQSKMMETVYVSWCKSVCRIRVVPPTTTRCEYLLYIVDDQDIKKQLLIRFTKFIQSPHQSSNANLCLELPGSRSNITNNIYIHCL